MILIETVKKSKCMPRYLPEVLLVKIYDYIIILGILYWFMMYPIDTVKTLIQSDNFEKPKYKGYKDAYT